MKRISKIRQGLLMALTITTVHFTANAGSMGDSGTGGETIELKRPTIERIVSVLKSSEASIPTLLATLELYLKNEANDLTNKNAPVAEDLMAQIFNSDLTILDLFKTKKMEVRTDKPCYDINHEPTEGSIYFLKSGDYCVSPFWMVNNKQSDFNSTNYLGLVNAVVVHELYHLIDINETRADLISNSVYFIYTYINVNIDVYRKTHEAERKMYKGLSEIISNIDDNLALCLRINDLNADVSFYFYHPNNSEWLTVLPPQVYISFITVMHQASAINGYCEKNPVLPGELTDVTFVNDRFQHYHTAKSKELEKTNYYFFKTNYLKKEKLKYSLKNIYNNLKPISEFLKDYKDNKNQVPDSYQYNNFLENIILPQIKQPPLQPIH